MDALYEQINTAVIGALKQGMRIEDILAALAAQEHQLRNAMPIVQAAMTAIEVRKGYNPC